MPTTRAIAEPPVPVEKISTDNDTAPPAYRGPRLRKMLVPRLRAAALQQAQTKPAVDNHIRPKDAEFEATAVKVATTTDPRTATGTFSTLTQPTTLARLPTIANLASTSPSQSGQAPNFSDHIAAVDDLSATAYPGYRAAIETMLAALCEGRRPGQPRVALLVGVERQAGTSSTALALAYRSAVSGKRTLLVDVSVADARLSHVFAGSLTQSRACILDSEAHLAEITLNDRRTGLSLLPLALADLNKFSPDQQRRLGIGLRHLIRRYDLVVFDAGIARESSSVAFLASLADRVLVVTPRRNAVTGLARLQAMEAARRFEAKDARANIVETSAG